MRLIPAHAGKTCTPSGRTNSWPAHPRSRGENLGRGLGRSRRSGSSPLTRGKRLPAFARFVRPGLIPAHAGKTRSCGRPASSRTAHPRSRGENNKVILESVVGGGSSPLTRGKPRAPPAHARAHRLIPAHAGKTCLGSLTWLHRPAHPRSRGENEIARAEDVNANGSSPLTRGKPHWRGRRPRRARLIPAHAGKTRTIPSRHRSRSAHPRSRGENLKTCTAVGRRTGSSPLTRGKPRPVFCAAQRRRLIPAHAGKTALCVVASTQR